jgi:hypothetical protein
MTDRQPKSFDPIDPEERTLLRRFQAWTDQAVAPEDPAAVVRVTAAGVRPRFRAGAAGGRWLFVAATALVAAFVVGGLALRMTPDRTATSGQSAEPTSGSGATPSAGATDASTIGPDPAPSESPAVTVLPTLELRPEQTPSPTRKPPKKTPVPDPDPTDSWHTDWTPPPGFAGTLTMSEWCFHSNGTAQVKLEAVYHTPVEITHVEFYLDGHWLANGGPANPEGPDSTITIGRDMDIGTTHEAMARFFTGPYYVDWVGSLSSDPYTVVQGSTPCGD